MKFGLKLDGEFSFNVIHPTSNRDVYHAILELVIKDKGKLSHEQLKSIGEYINTLENDNLFVDPCREVMTLSFGFEL